ncbi:MAG: HAD family hydrolase [Planctomycetia bacterium]|nr:HAD family hydrolase [Planctomycetia bacterium]
MSAPLRVAMWSGPRNISTAMMRSWGNRDDTVVIDEPLYACYLAATGKPHPGAAEVIAAGQTDWRRVVHQLTEQNLHSATVFYQKHMTHHLLSEMDREWLAKLTNCFLIRHPREVLASYTKIVETPELEDTGFPQQAEIFEWVRTRTRQTPPVLDATDVLKNPRRMLGLLCDALGVEFQEAMLSWSPGPRATDGVWARHWYGEVEKSTGFRPYQGKNIDLPERLRTLGNQCEPYYDLLYQHRLL